MVVEEGNNRSVVVVTEGRQKKYGGGGGKTKKIWWWLWRKNNCLVPVRRFPSPSRSIHFGDVSEAKERETVSHFRLEHVTRNALAARNNEA